MNERSIYHVPTGIRITCVDTIVEYIYSMRLGGFILQVIYTNSSGLCGCKVVVDQSPIMLTPRQLSDTARAITNMAELILRAIRGGKALTEHPEFDYLPDTWHDTVAPNGYDTIV